MPQHHLPPIAAACLERLATHGDSIRFTLSGRTTSTPDWTTHRRRLPLHLLYFVTSHRMLGTVGRHHVELRAGSLLWIAPEVEHHLWRPPGSPAFRVYYFRFASGRQLRSGFHVLAHNLVSLHPVLQQLLDELSRPRRFQQPLIRALLITVLATALRQVELADEGQVPLTTLQQEELRQLVEADPRRRLQPADLAAALRLSPDYFARVFRRSLGVSPKTWLLHQRVRIAAARLAETPLPIKEVAASLAYSDLYLFSRQFKQVMGVSPRGFRRTCSGASIGT